MTTQGGFYDILSLQGFWTSYSDSINLPLARTLAARHDFEFKLYIGPKVTQVETDGLITGRPFNATIETALTEKLQSYDVTMTVASTADFSTKALVILAIGDGDDISPEFVKWTSSDATHFYGLERTQPPAPATQPSSRVVEFVEVTDLIPGMNLAWNDSGGIAAWKVSLSGTGYDSSYLDNDNMFLCEMRQAPANYALDTWTNWHVWFIGYLRNCKIDDSGLEEKRWSGIVEPLSQYLNVNFVEPCSYGRTDLAAGKPITVSTELQDPYGEAGTGEYDGYPSLAGSNAVDGDISTLWISENTPSTLAKTFEKNFFSINEVFLRPRKGEPENLQWFEVAYRSDDQDRGLKDYVFATKNTVFGTTKNPQKDPWGNPLPDDEVRGPVDNYLQAPGGHSHLMTDDGSFTIFCEDKAQFLEKYPSCAAQYIFDWRKHAIGDFALDPENDFLLMSYGDGNRTSIVWWDAGTNPDWALYDFVEEPEGNDEMAGTKHSGWSGDMIPTDLESLPKGYSFRREPTNSGPDPSISADGISYWETSESYPTPGNYAMGRPEWIMVDLGEMGILLKTELSDTEVDEAELNREPIGLTDKFGPYGWDGGFIQLDEEVIHYQSRDWDNNKLLVLDRAQLGTSAAVHPVDTVVKQYVVGEYDTPSQAYTCHAIEEISWFRRAVYDSDGNFIIPMDFDFYISTMNSPINPGQGMDEGSRQSDWDDWLEPPERGGRFAYWDHLHHTAAYSGASAWGTGPYYESRRARWVLMLIPEMSDGGRVKLNELHVYAATCQKTVGEDDDYFDGIRTGEIVRDLLISGGFATEDVVSSGGSSIQDMQTSRASYLKIIQDICLRSGCCVLFGLDQTAEHRFHPLYPAAGIDPVEITWDRDSARDVSLDRPFSHNVSQVTVRVHDDQSDEWYEASYPPWELELGDKVELNDAILGGQKEAELFAETHFYQKSGPLTITVVPVGPAEWCKPYQRCLVTWDLDEDNTYLQGRNFIITGVNHKIKFGDGTPGTKKWDTNIQLKELIW